MTAATAVSTVATAVRRSAALPALPVLAALVVANVLARDRTWTHEWVWAHYQYGFVTVLLGPLAAGVAAWDGARLARSRALLGTADRTLGALAAAWAGAAFWVLASYLGGLVLVVALVKGAGTPGWPSPTALGASVPAAGLLTAETAAGLVTGWWLRHPLAAPAAAIGCFLTTLWLYQSGPGELVVVGGATSSLVNLAPRHSLQVLQVLWFGSAVVVLLVAAARFTGWGPRPGRWQLPAAACLSLAALVPLLHQGEVFLVPTSDRQVCVGSHPSVCVAPGYAPEAGQARRALVPYLDALRRIGVEVPETFRQNVPHGQQSVGSVDAGILLGDRRQAGFAVLAAYLSKDCPIDRDARVQDAFTGLAWWLYATVDRERPPDPTVPVIVQGPPSPAQTAWLVGAVRTLRDCAG